ncbi:putative holin-like toxin, partial [Granulicatella sp. 19428wC4_WM01]
SVAEALQLAIDFGILIVSLVSVMIAIAVYCNKDNKK